MPTNYSTCVCIRIPVLNFSRDKIFVVNVHPAKTAKIFNLENFRLYGSRKRTSWQVKQTGYFKLINFWFPASIAIIVVIFVPID